MTAEIFHFDGKGSGSRDSKVTTKRPKAKGLFDWCHLHAADPDTLTTLKALELDEFVIEALLADDTLPRFTVHGQGAILILRGVNLNEGQEPTDMVSLRIWIEADKVVTIWLRRSFAVRDVISAIEQGNSPLSPADLVCKIAFRLADRAEPTIAEMSEKMDALEEEGEAGNFSSAQKGLVSIRQDSAILRRYIMPQRDAFTTFAIEEFNWMKEREQSRLREAAERISRLGKELDSIRERAMITHDQILSERSDRMNKTMLILTVLSAIFLPLGLLAGLLGINVGGIPGAENPYGFWIVTGGIAVVGLVLWLVVRLSKLME